MREVPECLQRRYKALDQLVNELNSAMSKQNSKAGGLQEIGNDVGIKLMCQFWNILKEDPECNLTQAVKQRMCIDTKNSGLFQRQQFHCFMSNDCRRDDDKDRRKRKECNINDAKSSCCQQSCPQSQTTNPTGSQPLDSNNPSQTSTKPSLSKVLCNLNQAASFDMHCNDRLNELSETENQLQEQIQYLEQQEKKGVQLLKQADCMWSCMEDTYKRKLQESNQKQKNLLKQLREAETGAKTWRKNRQDLESQMEGLRKCQLEMIHKVNQKTNDLKCIDIEIEGLQKRLEMQTKDADAALRSLSTKKQTSELKLNMISGDCIRVEKEVEEENQNKMYKERNINKLVKAARDELKRNSKVLLLKRLGNENLVVEKQVVLKELELLNENFNQCKELCSNREKSVIEELNTLNTEIENFKLKCTQCHESTDTVDVRKLCKDCPRCATERECLYKDGQCTHDKTMDCVCESVKEKFLSNVLENMQNILERESETGPGKAVADCVLKCLKKSLNGKVDKPTRKILRDFILTAVKKNLTLTIVGGAVKTRCEMDKNTYEQLMLCLEHFKETKSKSDKAKDSKKEPCGRWGGTRECHCPGDKKTCICMKKAPPPSNEPLPESSEKDEDHVEVKICRDKNVTCGVECGVPGVPSNVETDVATIKDPSKKPQFGSSMRAVQCVLGPESLSTSQFFALKPDIQYKTSKISLSEALRKVSAKSIKIEPCEHDKIHDLNAEHAKEEVHIKRELQNKVTTDTEYDKKSREKDKSKIKAQNLTTQEQRGNYELLEINSQMNKEVNTREIKVIIKDDNGEMVSHSAKLIITAASETPGLALDKKIVAFIKKKVKDDPNVIVILKETMSGHFLLNFSAIGNLSSNCHRFRTKVTNSGNVILQAHTSFIKKMQSTVIASELDSNNRINYFLDAIGKEYETSNKVDEELNTDELQQNKNKVKVKIHSGEFKNVDAVVTETLSGSILLDLKEPSDLTKLNEDHRLVNSLKEENEYNKLNPLEECLHKENKPGSLWSKSNNLSQVQTKETNVDKQLNKNENIDKTLNNNIKHAKEEDRKESEFIGDLNVILKKQSPDTISTISNNISVFSETTLKGNLYPVRKRTNEPSCFNTHKVSYDERIDTLKSVNNDAVECTSSVNGSALQVYLKKTLVNKSVNCNGCETEIGINEELTNMYEQNNKLVKIFVKGENGIYMINATLIQTLSRNIALEVKNVRAFGEIFLKNMDYPVLLSKHYPGSYSIDLRRKFSDERPNAVLRNTPSGRLLVLLVPPVLKPWAIVGQKDENESKRDVYKVRLEGVGHDMPPALLQLTPSGNYIFVLDKEFENRYKKTIQHFIGDDNKCSVSLSKTNSSNYVINFDNDRDRQNAWLFKSHSQNMKLLVKGPKFEALGRVSLVGKSKEQINYSIQIDKLLHNSLSCNTYGNGETSTRRAHIETKSNSDSHLYDRTIIDNLLDDNESVLVETSDVHQRTTSGHYAVILNKESKKSFINNLKSYLASSPHKLIPIKKTESGEIVIGLNYDDGGKGRYVSLKITSSGNIYVFVDESVIKRISKDVIDERNDGAVRANAVSEQVTSLLQSQENNSITVICNSRHHDISCDSYHCAYRENQSDINPGFRQYSKKDTSSSIIIEKSSNGDHQCSEGSFKTCDSSVRSQCCSTIKSNKKAKYKEPLVPGAVKSRNRLQKWERKY